MSASSASVRLLPAQDRRPPRRAGPTRTRRTPRVPRAGGTQRRLGPERGLPVQRSRRLLGVLLTRLGSTEPVTQAQARHTTVLASYSVPQVKHFRRESACLDELKIHLARVPGK